jgi:hypothetical protein
VFFQKGKSDQGNPNQTSKNNPVVFNKRVEHGNKNSDVDQVKI